MRPKNLRDEDQETAQRLFDLLKTKKITGEIIEDEGKIGVKIYHESGEVKLTDAELDSKLLRDRTAAKDLGGDYVIVWIGEKKSDPES